MHSFRIIFEILIGYLSTSVYIFLSLVYISLVTNTVSVMKRSVKGIVPFSLQKQREVCTPGFLLSSHLTELVRRS